MKDRIVNFFTKGMEAIQESPVWADLQTRFDELDQKQQKIVAVAGLGTVALVVFMIPLMLAFSVNAKKSSISDLDEMTLFLIKTNNEIRDLKLRIKRQGKTETTAANPNAAPDEIAQISLKNGQISEGSYELQPSSAPGVPFGMKLDRISLRQLVRVLYSIESASALVTELSVDTRNDTKGYMWANLKFVRERPTEDQDKKSFSR